MVQGHRRDRVAVGAGRSTCSRIGVGQSAGGQPQVEQGGFFGSDKMAGARGPGSSIL